MSDHLVFYTNPMSRGRIIRWMLEEIGKPYRTEVLGYDASMKSAAFLAVNPMGKVPAIVHRGVTVTECAAICAYLADAFPDARLAPPPGDTARGAYFRWLFFAAGPLEAAIADRTLGVSVPDDKQAMVGYGTYDRTIDALETAVRASAFIAGDRFSAADLYVGSHLMWGMQFGTIPKRPAFETYTSSFAKRPAAIRAAEIDDALIAAQKGAAAPKS